jgi:hypothetical protein
MSDGEGAYNRYFGRLNTGKTIRKFTLMANSLNSLPNSILLYPSYS